MAGGQGTRLGHNGPKGTYDIGLNSHKSLFELLSDHLKEEGKKCDVMIPWFIMTSRENNKATVEFFEKNKYFGYQKDKNIFFSGFFRHFYVCAVQSSDRQRAVDHEFHISGSAGFFSGERNLFGNFRCRHEFFRHGNVVVFHINYV